MSSPCMPRRGAVLRLWPAVLGLGALMLAPSHLVAQEEAGYMDAPAVLTVTTSSDVAKEQFWNGVTEMDNVFFNKAATAFEAALAADSALGLARVYFAFSAPGLTQEGRLAQVRRGLASMTSATPAEILMGVGVREWIAGNQKAGHRLFATASDLAPGDRHVAYTAAWTAVFGGDTANGVTRLKDVTVRFPDYAPTWNLLSYQLWNRNDHAGGLAAVKKYTELMPEHPNAHDSYAELLQWDGKLAEAGAHYRKALSLDPEYTAGYTGLAEVAVLQGQYAEARMHLGDFRTHAASPQGKINADRAIAGTYVMEGKLEAAMEGYAKAASDAEAGDYKGLARTSHRQAAVVDAMFGKGRGAKAHMARAAKVMESDSVGQFAAGVLVAAYSGNLPAARGMLERLDRATEGNAGWDDTRHHFRAILLLKEKKADEALAELAKADQADDWTRALTAQAFERQGKKAEAAALREEVRSNGRVGLFNFGMPMVRHMAANGM